MIYRAIGVMSGSSLDGLDIAFVEFEEQGGKWTFSTRAAECIPYSPEWKDKLKQAPGLSAADHCLLHTAFGRFIGEKITDFITRHQLPYQVGLVSSHGHTSFHFPGQHTSVQIGDGASIAAKTGLPVVTDLRNMDVALGGQGAPIVPIGEKHLLPDYDLFLNIGGIANLSSIKGPQPIAFDVCPANRVLNMLAEEQGRSFDEGGAIAASGKPDAALIDQLNALPFYGQPFPRSLANEFGTQQVFPIIKNAGLSPADALCSYAEHIAIQVKAAVRQTGAVSGESRMLVTGGGAFNLYLVERITHHLREAGITVEVPDPSLVNFKEAIIMAFIGVLRWRQEINVLGSVTGASRDSIGGALWAGE